MNRQHKLISGLLSSEMDSVSHSFVNLFSRKTQLRQTSQMKACIKIGCPQCKLKLCSPDDGLYIPNIFIVPTIMQLLLVLCSAF